MASSLPIDLRFLAAYLARSARSGLGLTPDQCERTAVLLREAAKEADHVVGQAELVPELDDELHAVATDLDRVVPEPVAPGYQAALKAQQREIQRELDGGGAVPVSRPSLAALAVPVPGTNLVIMPRAPWPHPFGGGAA